MNAKHITDISIENFRGFDRLQLGGLQAVNLIVGQNNAGKTSLLEALNLIAEPTSMNQMPGRLRTSAGNVEKRYFRWLLKDNSETRSGSIVARVAGHPQTLAFSSTRPAAVPPGMAVVYNSQTLTAWIGGEEPTLKTRVISVQHRAPQDLIPSFGNAVRRRQGEEMMHQILRAVDSRILRVRVDPVEEGNIISVDVGLTESIPLSQAGQGIYRLVAVLSDLIGDTPQVCIIDEIENGLHHTVMAPVWRGIREISARLGIQIFATTHSGECLAAAQRVFYDEDPEAEYDFAVIQLMRVKDRVEGRVLSEARVEAALETEIELR